MIKIMIGFPGAGQNIAMTNRAVALNDAKLERLEKRIGDFQNELTSNIVHLGAIDENISTIQSNEALNTESLTNITKGISEINDYLELVSGRLDDIDNNISSMNGKLLTFEKSTTITGSVLSDVLNDVTSASWQNSSTINNATVYVCSEFPNDLSPTGMWKAIISGEGIPSMERGVPLEYFIRNTDGSSLRFKPFEPSDNQNDITKQNIGGDIISLIRIFGTGVPIEEGDVLTALTSNLISAEFSTAKLYYIQNTDLISANFGTSAESFSLHFE